MPLRSTNKIMLDRKTMIYVFFKFFVDTFLFLFRPIMRIYYLVHLVVDLNTFY